MSYWRIGDSRGGFFGYSNFKTASDDIKNGSVIARDGNRKVIVRIENGQIVSERCLVDGKTQYLCHYGNVSKRKGKYYLNYRDGSARQLDGLSRRWDENLFGYKGTCHSFYRRGRIMWQKFWYSNGRLAYHWNCRKESRYHLFIKDPSGNPLFEFNGLEGPATIKFKDGGSFQSKEVIVRDELDTRKIPLGSIIFHTQQGISKHGHYEIKRWRKDRLHFAGITKNNQRVGKWYEEGKIFYYERGVKIPRKLYETPIEKIDPRWVLGLDNAQLRGAFITKIGVKRIVEAVKGKVIHQDKDMELLSIPMRGAKDIAQEFRFDIENGRMNVDRELRVLKVVCPTTRTNYFLPVPPEAKECEEARQWTFGVPLGSKNRIKFAVET